MGTKLYVGNLSFNTTENELQELFAQAGTVQEVTLMQDKFTGKSRGFAFVTMSSEQEAQNAITQFNGKSVEGRSLTVNEARPREPRPPGGGGGGRGYGGGGGGRRWRRLWWRRRWWRLRRGTPRWWRKTRPINLDTISRKAPASAGVFCGYKVLEVDRLSSREKTGQGWIRTSEGVKPADLQSAPFGHSGTYPRLRALI